MRVAIIGAGLAGLSCAFQLEKYNISPVVYEDMPCIGDKEFHISALLDITERPIADPLNFFDKNFGLYIKPVNTIKKLTHFSPKKTVTVTSSCFGYLLKRGKDNDSVKMQIYSQLENTKVILGTRPDPNELAKEFDFVVVADGKNDITKQFGLWTDWLSGWVFGAKVKGTFDKNEILMWINREYCKNGYAYLCPYSDTIASLLLFIPSVSMEQTKYYWQQFLKYENFTWEIMEEFMIHHTSGYLSTHNVDKFYFIGNAGGAVSPFLGFGQSTSISMGLYAAQAIVEGSDFEKLIKVCIEKENENWEIRKAFDKLSNKGYDHLLTLLSIPAAKILAYDTNIDVIKHAAKVIKLYNDLKDN